MGMQALAETACAPLLELLCTARTRCVPRRLMKLP
jgi:hypothetical protein